MCSVPIQEARLTSGRMVSGSIIRKANEGVCGWIIFMFSWYMSLTSFLRMMTLLPEYRCMTLFPSVANTPALSSCMPLMRFVLAAGMWSTFHNKTEHLSFWW